MITKYHRHSLFLVLLFFLLPLCTHASTISVPANFLSLNTGLVGYWTLDGKDINWATNTIVDKSGNGNTGTLENMSTTTSPIVGKVGQALRFDGTNDAINAGSGSSLDDIQSQGGGGMTISFWIRPTTNTTKTIMGKAASAGGTGRWGLTKTSNTNPARMSFSKQGTVTSTKNYNSLLTVGVWQHIVLTWNGSMTFSTGVVVYKNAAAQVLLSATDGSGATSDASGILCVGADPGIAVSTCTGGSAGDEDMDDIRLYNRVLSTSEIQQLYNIGLTRHAASPIVTATSTCSVGLSCGLVGYWTFDGKDTNWNTNTTVDKSGNGNTGRFLNMSTTTSPALGKVGQALRTDGVDDIIVVNPTASINDLQTTGMTISTWIKTTSISAGTLLSKGDNSSGGHGWMLYLMSTGKLTFGVPGFGTTDLSVPTANNVIVSNQWTHVLVTWDGSALTSGVHIYKNGVELGQVGSSNGGAGPSSDASFGIQIGSNTGGGGNGYYAGMQDDVRIYNRTLSTSEIQQLYNIGVGTHQASSPAVTATSTCSVGLSCGLVGYWTFDGKDTNWNTNTTVDKSGNGNTGTLISMSTTTSPVPGKVGQGLRFPGSASSYINISNPALLPIGAFTVSAWVFNNVNSSAAGVAYGTSTAFGAVGLVYNAGWRCAYGNSNTTNLNEGSNKWILEVCTFDGTTLKAYQNGVYKNSITPTPLTDTMSIGTIGRYPNTSNFPLDGFIDDVRIYNRALSADEVGRLYSIGR